MRSLEVGDIGLWQMPRKCGAFAIEERDKRNPKLSGHP